MSQRTVLVSGAAGNLGSAVVQHFLASGDRVIGLVRRSRENIAAAGYKEIAADLTCESETEKLIRELVAEYQKIDLAVLTTGGFALGNLEKTGAKELLFQYELNFLTVYHVVRPLLAHFKESENGKFFFIGSEPGMDTSKGKSVVAYSLAKSQLFQLAQLINADARPSGVQAYVVVPGTMDTPQNRKAVPDADFSRWQKPSEIAGIIGRYAAADSPGSVILTVAREKQE